MRVSTLVSIFCACASFSAPTLLAQQWEVGVLGGGSFYLNNSITGGGTGKVGFRPGFTAGGWLGQNGAGRVGGEIRYQFQWNQMKVTSGGSSYNFGGLSHSLHYDVLIHTRDREDRVRPFFAVGGGMKGYFGTGREIAQQPLSNVAILTRTYQWQPMLSVGGGVKWALGSRMIVRAEVRDLITPFPKDVILPTPGNKVSGWMHSIMPLVGLSYLF